MEQGFFQKLITTQLGAGTVTSQQADALMKVFSVIPEPQRMQIQDLFTKEPKTIPLVIDNILQKIKAVEADSVDAWKKVVADQLVKLDALQ